MSKKISQLDLLTPEATAFFTFVVGGDNKKCTFDTMLYAETGTPRTFGANGGSIVFDADGACVVNVPSGQLVRVQVDGETRLEIDADGNTVVSVPEAAAFTVDAGVTGFLQIDRDTPSMQWFFDDASVEVSYVPQNPGDWDSDPDWQHVAIDRIARALSSLLGTPIPD